MYLPRSPKQIFACLQKLGCCDLGCSGHGVDLHVLLGSHLHEEVRCRTHFLSRRPKSGEIPGCFCTVLDPPGARPPPALHPAMLQEHVGEGRAGQTAGPFAKHARPPHRSPPWLEPARVQLSANGLGGTPVATSVSCQVEAGPRTA